MSILRDYSSKTIDDFAGPDLLSDAASRQGAVLARNIRWLYKEPIVRLGFAESNPLNSTVAVNSQSALALPSGLGITHLYHWLQSTWSRLIMFNPDGAGHPTSGFARVVNWQLNNGIVQDVVEVPAATTGVSFGEFGSRLIMTFFDDDGAATTPGKIWNGLFSSNPLGAIVDNLFVDPMVEGTHYSVSYAEPVAGANNVTEGEHKFGIVWITRNGYETKATVFNNTFTASGGKIVRITLANIDVEDWSLDLRIIMTTAANPNLFYFIPGQIASLPPGLPNVIIDIDITDDQLAASATEATEWFDIASLSDIGNVKYAGPYGSRYVYLVDQNDAANTLGTVTRIWISDVADPQRLAADRNVQQLPGLKKAVTFASLFNVLYVLGPSWTYSFSDTTDFPVEWFPPETIDDRIGTIWPHGISANKSRGLLWVASADGLYTLTGGGGSYPELPVSFFQSPDWDRINRTAPVNNLHVVDDALNEVVYVLAPLDGNTRNSHIMSWDYKRGIAPGKVRYSLQSLLNAEGMMRPGAIEIVENFTTKIPELCLTQATANPVARGKVWRQKSEKGGDASVSLNNLYTDDGFGIDAQYRTQNPIGLNGAPVRHGAGRWRATGNGLMRLQAYRLSGNSPVPAKDLELDLNPEKLQLRMVNLNNEACYWDVWNRAIPGAWFRLSSVEHFYKKWLAQR